MICGLQAAQQLLGSQHGLGQSPAQSPGWGGAFEAHGTRLPGKKLQLCWYGLRTLGKCFCCPKPRCHPL